MLSPEPLAERVVIVTGASAGLGTAMARAVVAAGGHAVLAARRADRLAAIAAELGTADTVPCDVARDEDRERLVATTLERHGRLDGLVNNAGIDAPGPASREPVDVFRRVIELNLVATFHLAQLAAAAMRRTDGSGASIVNIASVLGVRSAGDMPEAAYVASKAGVIGLTRELGSQWGRHGVRVNAIAPGFFPSEMTEGLAGPGGEAPEWLARETPLGRLGRPDELGGAVVFLLSAASSFVTGETLLVDGGLATR
jgi:NAD(P)-dependent dehydrogenase (short-subunit alcohol dehydrogenase family)